jgi:hypothetical protein
MNNEITTICRKCGAEGTHHCSMPGCPLPPLKVTETRLRFMCEQLREWGGLPEAEIRRIYEAETKRLVEKREGQVDA